MASFSLKKKLEFTAFAERRNQHTQVLCILRLQDLRILATHLKGLEKDDLADLTHARMLQLQELGLAATVTNTLTTRVSLKDLPKRANLKLGWI